MPLITETDLRNPMPRHFARADQRHGTLSLEFTDAAHLADTISFAEQNGLLDQLARDLMRLLRVNLGTAVPRIPDIGAGVGAIPGNTVRVSIIPDGFNEPSFGFSRDRNGHFNGNGGLIFHPHNRSWGIHT
jgi:hypothetical protein